MKVGYVGLGAMGRALALQLKSTHSIVVWDNNPKTLESLPSKMIAASSAAELARQCDVVFLCLPSTPDVQQAIFAPGGLLEGLSAGNLLVDQTSGMPGDTRALASSLSERGIAMIDAPISGSPEVVAQGKATVMASGPDDAYHQALPLLQAISPTVIRCGTRVGDAQAMKLVNNAMNAGSRLSTLEVVAMGTKMGLTLESMTDILNKGSGRNYTSEHMLTALVQGKTSTNMALPLMLKDLNLAASLGVECDVPMHISNVVRGLLQIGVNTLGPKARLEDVVGLIGSMAATRLAPAPQVQAPPQNFPEVAAREPVVGYVGLGVMGGALARRMLLSRKLHVFDVRTELARELEAQGAIVQPDLPSLARACDVIMVCVPTSAVVRKLIFGPNGLAEGLAAGKIIVDQTTGDPTEARAIANDLRRLDVSLVDAPVAGGPRGADAGTIAIYYGGPIDIFGPVRAVLESISPNVVYCGDTGNGHVAKLVNASIAATNRLITYECAALGAKYGLSVPKMAEVINQSSGRNAGSERILPVLATHGTSANFQLELMVKDLRLGARMAIDGGAPMIIAGVIRNLFEIGMNHLGRSANLDDMAHLFEEMASFKFDAS
ncbi:3-hydroxyisobutyrate dehydrogenase [Variovorax sp. Sphag1AA]|nr:NAD(P)-dependent oxidoreductase [Variovorax sp. Sphag1AA]MBB3181049.1 3-hydroxyisobutyrate dehydrogenase [Variovorax sp. Sphag1AA]